MINAEDYFTPARARRRGRGNGFLCALFTFLRVISLWGMPAIASGAAPDAQGDWGGWIETPNRAAFEITLDRKELGWVGTARLSSWGDHCFGLEQLSVIGRNLSFAFTSPSDLNGIFSGDCRGDEIVGNYQIGARTYNVRLSRGTSVLKRQAYLSQVPSEPLPYRVKLIGFANGKDNFSAILSTPTGRPAGPALLILPGSQARSANIPVPGDPFTDGIGIWEWVLADHFCRMGISVLQMDSRGEGGSSGSFDQCTMADLINDALAGVSFLRKQGQEVDPSKIGLVGFSEGAAICPAVGALDKGVAFIVMLSAPVEDGKTIELEQGERLCRWCFDEAGKGLAKKWGTNSAEIRSLAADNQDILKQRSLQLKDELALLSEGWSVEATLVELDHRGLVRPSDDLKLLRHNIESFSKPHARSWLAYDPRVYLKMLKTPILAISGSEDRRIRADENLRELRGVFAESGASQVTVVELPSLTHCLRRFSASDPWEIGYTTDTIDQSALTAIDVWIEARVRSNRSAAR